MTQKNNVTMNDVCFYSFVSFCRRDRHVYRCEARTITVLVAQNISFTNKNRARYRQRTVYVYNNMCKLLRGF